MKYATDLFLHKKPAGIILSLKRAKETKRRVYASILAKENDCTYTHVLKIISKLENLGLVKSKSVGRIKEVILTDLGYELSLKLNDFFEELWIIPLISVEGIGKSRAKKLINMGIRTPDDLKDADISVLIPILGVKLSERTKSGL